MTTITIVPDAATFRAVAGPHRSTGKTPGEALDALAAQLPPDQAGTLLVVQQFRPDAFFAADQCRRLDDLMTRWRAAHAAGTTLPPDEHAELDALVAAELAARGVAFTGPVTDRGYGLVTHFTMPGGVVVQLYQPLYSKGGQR
jgi:hypothetical protein